MRERDKPTLSVIMGVLQTDGDLRLLRRSVDSILNQTWRDFEFLICDDGSCPAVQRFLETYSRDDSRVRLIRGCVRKDLAPKLNACLAQARGRYIARMDGDDESFPNRFDEQLSFLRAHPDIAFVGSNVELFRNGAYTGTWCFPERPAVEDFYIRQPFIHPALVFRRDALDAVGFYSEEPRCIKCEDYDLLLRLYEKQLFGANLPQFLLRYSLTADPMGNRTMRDRMNESKTRWVRFGALNLLPGALPYVVKPVAAGLLPAGIIARIKKKAIHV